MTGDSRFPGGVGKTWEPGGFEQLLGDDTTLGEERPHLAGWRERGW